MQTELMYHRTEQGATFLVLRTQKSSDSSGSQGGDDNAFLLVCDVLPHLVCTYEPTRPHNPDEQIR
jgi:hypothetical protein